MDVFPCFAEGCKLTYQYLPEGLRVSHNGGEATRFFTYVELDSGGSRWWFAPHGIYGTVNSAVLEFFEQAHKYGGRGKEAVEEVDARMM